MNENSSQSSINHNDTLGSRLRDVEQIVKTLEAKHRAEEERQQKNMLEVRFSY